MRNYVVIAFLLSYSALQAQNITIQSFKITYPATGKVRVDLQAAGTSGVKVNSYMVRVGEQLPRRPFQALPGMTLVKGIPYLTGTDFTGEQAIFLKDNGMRDGDKRQGYFSITLDISRWPVSRYYITVFAHNRPATGTYYMANRIFQFDVGKPDFRNIKVKPNVPGAKNVVIYRNPSVYACFPSLVKLSSGQLYTVFNTRERSTHIDPKGSTKAMISKDGGNKWSVTSKRYADPLSRMKDGKEVMASAEGWKFTSSSQKKRLMQENKEVMDVNPNTVAWLNSGAYFKVSEDGGKTWKKEDIAVPKEVKGMLNFQNFKSRDGIRIVTTYGKRKSKAGGTDQSEVYFLRSDDDGRSWHFVYLTPMGLRGKLNLTETTVAELANGDYLAMIRAEDGKNMYSSISTDKGKTWSYPTDTGIWGNPPELLVLKDGTVLCIYGYRRAPMGIRACISRDNGRTWDIKNELILRSDGLAANVGDLGYPKITELSNGELFTIYYIATDGGMPYIAGTHFRLPK